MILFIYLSGIFVTIAISFIFAKEEKSQVSVRDFAMILGLSCFSWIMVLILLLIGFQSYVMEPPSAVLRELFSEDVILFDFSKKEKKGGEED